MEAFPVHINTIDNCMKFTCVDVKDVHIKTAYQGLKEANPTRPIPTFWITPPTTAQAEGHQNQNHQAKNGPNADEGKEKEKQHITNAIKTCGPSLKVQEKNISHQEKKK